MKEVEWIHGSECGFKDREAAQRFIDMIGKVVAPTLDYRINNLITI